ncbi:hypothetical protein [Nonomuraea indica]|uniref:hypothetical protein n=1 Tax=Nonomuraea indica TaxID=1581193 RepID=UPI0011832463|nr:hypothetical protein [Nonomuraea indica]
MPRGSRPVLVGSFLLAILVTGSAEVAVASGPTVEQAPDVTARPATLGIPCTSIPFERLRINCVAKEVRERRTMRRIRSDDRRRYRRDRDRERRDRID